MTRILSLVVLCVLLSTPLPVLASALKWTVVDEPVDKSEIPSALHDLTWVKMEPQRGATREGLYGPNTKNNPAALAFLRANQAGFRPQTAGDRSQLDREADFGPFLEQSYNIPLDLLPPSSEAWSGLVEAGIAEPVERSTAIATTATEPSGSVVSLNQTLQTLKEDFDDEAEQRAKADARLANQLQDVFGRLEQLEGGDPASEQYVEEVSDLSAQVDGMTADFATIRDQNLRVLSLAQSLMSELRERRDLPAGMLVQARQEAEKVLGDLPAEVQALRIEVAELSGRVTTLGLQVGAVDARVGQQGERLAAQEGRLGNFEFELDEVADTADRALEQVGGLTADGGVIALLREDVAKLTADDGPLEGLRGEINALTQDGGRLAVVEGKLTAVTADGEPIESLQALLDALVIDGGIIDQAVNNAMAAYEKRLARAENPFRSALVTVYPPAVDWSSGRQMMALALAGAIALLMLVIMVVLVARFVTRKERAQAKANDRTLHGYTEKLGTWWARLRGKARVVRHPGIKATVDGHGARLDGHRGQIDENAEGLKAITDRLDDPVTGLSALGQRVQEAQETASAALAASSQLEIVDVPDPKMARPGDVLTCRATDSEGIRYEVTLTTREDGTFDTTLPRAVDQSHTYVTQKAFKSRQAIVNWLNTSFDNGRGPLQHCVVNSLPKFQRRTEVDLPTEPEPA